MANSNRGSFRKEAGSVILPLTSVLRIFLPAMRFFTAGIAVPWMVGRDRRLFLMVEEILVWKRKIGDVHKNINCREECVGVECSYLEPLSLPSLSKSLFTESPGCGKVRSNWGFWD
jgi:hypothetical protein